MRKLSSNTSHINNEFGAQNLGVIIGIPGVQYSGSYGEIVLGTSSTHTTPVDNNKNVELSVSHYALHYSSDYNDYRITNCITCK